MERDKSGDENLWLWLGVLAEIVVAFVEEEEEEEGEGEGDIYLEETCLPLGFLGLLTPFRALLSFSEGKRGGLVPELVVGFSCCS